MMESEEDEADAVRQSVHLALEPVPLWAARNEGRIAVEREQANTRAERDLVPAASTQRRESIPPILETLCLRATGELVIAQHRIDVETKLPPGSRLVAIHPIVVG